MAIPEVQFDGGTIDVSNAREVRCLEASSQPRWRLQLPPASDTYFDPYTAVARVLAGRLLVTTTAAHCKDETEGFVQLHRIAEGGKLAWSHTPDPNADGMVVCMTTTGLLVIAAWEAARAVAGAPQQPVVARLLDPDTGAVRGEHVIDVPLSQGYPRMTLRISGPRSSDHHLVVEPRLVYPAHWVGFEAEREGRPGTQRPMLPREFGKPLP